MAVVVSWLIGLAPAGITLALTVPGYLPGWIGYPLAMVFLLFTLFIAERACRLLEGR